MKVPVPVPVAQAALFRGYAPTLRLLRAGHAAVSKKRRGHFRLTPDLSENFRSADARSLDEPDNSVLATCDAIACCIHEAKTARLLHGSAGCYSADSLDSDAIR